jgi:hypothetical protein
MILWQSAQKHLHKASTEDTATQVRIALPGMLGPERIELDRTPPFFFFLASPAGALFFVGGEQS